MLVSGIGTFAPILRLAAIYQHRRDNHMFDGSVKHGNEAAAN